MFLFLLFLQHALAFIFFLLASLCSFFLFWPRAVVLSMASTPCWSSGSLPAPRLVLRRCSVSPGSAPRRVCRYNVFWEFCLRASQSSRPLPLHVGGIEERFISQSLTLLLVGRAGWLHLQRRQNHLPAPPARTAPLRSSQAFQPSPRTPRMGLVKGKNPFQDFLKFDIIMIIKKNLY